MVVAGRKFELGARRCRQSRSRRVYSLVLQNSAGRKFVWSRLDRRFRALAPRRTASSSTAAVVCDGDTHRQLRRGGGSHSLRDLCSRRLGCAGSPSPESDTGSLPGICSWNQARGFVKFHVAGAPLVAASNAHQDSSQQIVRAHRDCPLICSPHRLRILTPPYWFGPPGPSFEPVRPCRKYQLPKHCL